MVPTEHTTPAPRKRTARIGRIPIRHLSPRQPENRWPAKSYLGEVVPFEATVFREGHGLIGAELLLIDPACTATAHAMTLLAPGTDRWRVEVRPETTGRNR
jgi:starch synthase (maltosyl-transferring)